MEIRFEIDIPSHLINKVEEIRSRLHEEIVYVIAELDYPVAYSIRVQIT